MLLKVDHYTSLARVDRDSYEARGAVYDRALTALVKRLNAALPPYSPADIEMEARPQRSPSRRARPAPVCSRTCSIGGRSDRRAARPWQSPILASTQSDADEDFMIAARIAT